MLLANDVPKFTEADTFGQGKGAFNLYLQWIFLKKKKVRSMTIYKYLIRSKW